MLLAIIVSLLIVGTLIFIVGFLVGEQYQKSRDQDRFL